MFIPSLSFSQESSGQLAYRYFRDKEYEAASHVFNELYQTTKSRNYFSYYIACLIKIENFSKAEKDVKREIRRHPNDRMYKIELGFVYKSSGKKEKAYKHYNKTIDNIIPNKREFITVANALRGKGEHLLSIKAYKKGRLVLKDKHLFHMEIANILMYQRNFEKMLNEYLIALSIMPEKRMQVQSQLQAALSQDINSDLNQIIKSEVVRQIQNRKNNLVYKELLLWYYTYKKDFDLALTLAQSIDLIINNSGENLILLAQTANNNKSYSIAHKCYQLVLGKGINSKYYNTALIGNLESQHLTLDAKFESKREEWKALSLIYSDYFRSLKNINYSIHTLIRFSHLNAFKLNKIKQADSLLRKALSVRNMKQTDVANIKLELADITLLDNKQWDAILLYSQIEQQNKNNPIGNKAKLKKATVSYYLGELDWAKAQLDVLKGSTSKLIANDALNLSQLISDNTTLDSTYAAMKYFAEIDFLIFQSKLDSAKIKLNRFLKDFPNHSLKDEVHYRMYEILNSQQHYDKAIEQLDIIIKEHPYENIAAKALYKQAKIFEFQNEVTKSGDNYKKIIVDYPESIYSVDAREKYAKIRNSQ